jgi:sec-independent protein translocase protein TatA
MVAPFAFFEGLLAPSHIIILLILGILFFGKRMPEIGRSLGKGIVEFKKGLKGLEDGFEDAAVSSPARQDQPVAEQMQIRPPQRVTASAPKFEDTPNNVQAPQGAPKS